MTEPRRVFLYRTEDEATSHGCIDLPQQVQEVRPVAQTEAEARLRKATNSELAVANDRLRHVLCFLNKAPNDGGSTVSLRTLRRWLAAYRTAERTCGSGYLGLLPERAAGNSIPKLPEETRALMCESIASDYESPKQKTKYACWIALKLACERGRIVAPSYKTYCTAVLHRFAFEQTLHRQGHRAAYSRKPFYWHLELRRPCMAIGRSRSATSTTRNWTWSLSAVEPAVVWAEHG